MTDLRVDSATRDDALRTAVSRVRGHRRRRLLLEGVTATVAAVLLALIVGAVVRSLMGPGSDTTIAVRVIGYLLIAVAAARFVIYPLLGAVSDERIALYVEERAPHLRQTLLSAVHELERPLAERSSAGLSARVIGQATAAVAELEQGAALERPRARRAGALLAGATAVGLALVLLGPGAVRDAARLLFVPWTASASEPVFAVSVTPGDITVPRGAALDVRGVLRGFTAAEAEIVFRADSTTEWLRAPMQRDSTGSGFAGRLFDLLAPTKYYLEADGLRSAEFSISVVDLPAVSNVALQLRFPGYTHLPPEEIESGGDVAALVGTTVRVHGTVTMPVKGGTLR
ncbi:MAG: hypothetical protein KA745_14580, partial [Gemmatimonadales bacterium]|nr:hypothetical protein [Gemmatimonadales bacterium]